MTVKTCIEGWPLCSRGEAVTAQHFASHAALLRAFWKATDDGAGARALATQGGDLDGVPGTWLPSTPGSAVVGI